MGLGAAFHAIKAMLFNALEEQQIFLMEEETRRKKKKKRKRKKKREKELKQESKPQENKRNSTEEFKPFKINCPIEDYMRRRPNLFDDIGVDFSKIPD